MEPAASHSRRAGTLASVGIPQGLIADGDSGNVVGAVRRAGSIVSLKRREYEIWLLLLTPLTDEAIVSSAFDQPSQDASALTERLLERGLLVRNDPQLGISPELERLRPIPLGMGLGNRTGDPERFALQNPTLSLPAPLTLDPVGTALWWNFDGATSLCTAVDAVSGRIEALPRIAVECAAAVLVRDLMTHRLLYLDATTPPD